ncbi:hypothetical protein B0H13DRAFT_1857358 [Mycena leptocephala]|nr:hypothetical protein B0H13DRAFT_1857358 [Mycena leptocephala]
MSVVLRIVPNSAPMSGWYEITFTHRSDIPTDSLGLQLLQDFGYNDSIKIQKAFLENDQVISHLFREVVHSGKEKILHLTDEKATGFMDALHKVCIMASDDTPFVLPARRLLKDLCAAAKAFPPTLFLESDSSLSQCSPLPEKSATEMLRDVQHMKSHMGWSHGNPRSRNPPYAGEPGISESAVCGRNWD